MTIGKLQKIMSIEDDLNTHINGTRPSLFCYKGKDEKVASIRVQDNGIVCIKTKKG